MEQMNEPGTTTMEEEKPEQRETKGGEQVRKAFREQSPQEVRRFVKDRVRKGIAGIAGALEGLNEEVEQDHLPERTEKAIHNVGETTRKVSGTVRDETRQIRDSMKKEKAPQKAPEPPQ